MTLFEAVAEHLGVDENKIKPWTIIPANMIREIWNDLTPTTGFKRIEKDSEDDMTVNELAEVIHVLKLDSNGSH